MNVLLLSPGYPADMPEFTRGLAEAGARVFGVGDSPIDGLPPMVRRFLTEYIAVRSLWDEEAVIASLRERLRGQQLDRIECLWEPGILLAARLRQVFGVAGLDVPQAQRFRDKELMKQALDDAGIRTPRHNRLNCDRIELWSWTTFVRLRRVKSCTFESSQTCHKRQH